MGRIVQPALDVVRCVWGQEDVIESPERMIRRERLIVEHIERSASNAFLSQRSNKRGFIDHWPAPHIHDHAGWFHRCDFLRSDQTTALRCQRRRSDNIIGFGHHVGALFWSEALIHNRIIFEQFGRRRVA